MSKGNANGIGHKDKGLDQGHGTLGADTGTNSRGHNGLCDRMGRRVEDGLCGVCERLRESQGGIVMSAVQNDVCALAHECRFEPTDDLGTAVQHKRKKWSCLVGASHTFFSMAMTGSFVIVCVCVVESFCIIMSHGVSFVMAFRCGSVAVDIACVSW